MESNTKVGPTAPPGGIPGQDSQRHDFQSISQRAYAIKERVHLRSSAEQYARFLSHWYSVAKIRWTPLESVNDWNPDEIEIVAFLKADVLYQKEQAEKIAAEKWRAKVEFVKKRHRAYRVLSWLQENDEPGTPDYDIAKDFSAMYQAKYGVLMYQLTETDAVDKRKMRPRLIERVLDIHELVEEWANAMKSKKENEQQKVKYDIMKFQKDYNPSTILQLNSSASTNPINEQI